MQGLVQSLCPGVAALVLGLKEALETHSSHLKDLQTENGRWQGMSQSPPLVSDRWGVNAEHGFPTWGPFCCGMLPSLTSGVSRGPGEARLEAFARAE